MQVVSPAIRNQPGDEMFIKFKRLWKKVSLESSCDTVIIGGGMNGLATAYILARNHGITDLSVIEKRHIDSGGDCASATMLHKGGKL